MNSTKAMTALLVLGMVVAAASPIVVAHYFEADRVQPGVAKVEPAPVVQTHSARDVKEGELAYRRNCAMCHQLGGVGEVGVAPSIRNRDFLALASNAFIKKTVREGRQGTAMVSRRDISNKDLNNIIAYLRALPIAVPREVEVDLTAAYDGDAAAGEGKFITFCAPCHGTDGAGYIGGSSGPGIGLEGFLSVASDDYIFKTVKYGRTGTPMRSFIGPGGLAQLEEQDVYNIIAFLRSRDPYLEAQYAEDQGEELYNRNCAMCHKSEGAGEVGVAPSIGNRNFLALASDAFIKKTVRWGRQGTAMVPRKDITAQQLENIISYLRSLPGDVVPAIAVDPDKRYDGDAAAGQGKFATFCAPCHGTKGEGYIKGGSGPSIGLPGFLSTVSDDYIFKTVKYGRTGTPMRPFIGPGGLARLEEQDVNDIIVFLRSRTILP